LLLGLLQDFYPTILTINAKNGVVSMIARDYEKPVDKDKDNVYKVTITATDFDKNTDSKDLKDTCYSNEINLKACFRLEVNNINYFLSAVFLCSIFFCCNSKVL
jgi:hypothetical protein